MRSPTDGAGIVSFIAVVILTSTAGAQSPPVSLIPVATLQALMPVPDGWTKITERASQVALSPTCDYTFATATYTKDAMRLKVTLADSGGAADSLLTLAPMIVSLPDDYLEKVPPATVVTRRKIGGLPAAERWDGAKKEGDLTIVVDGRFVVSLEGSQLDGLDTLHGIAAQIDVKKLAAAK